MRLARSVITSILAMLGMVAVGFGLWVLRSSAAEVGTNELREVGRAIGLLAIAAGVIFAGTAAYVWKSMR